MEFTGTCFFYLFLIFVLYSLCNTGQKKGNIKYIVAAYIILFVVSAIRFDVGNDFDRYVDDIKYIFQQSSNSGKNLFQAFNEYDGEFSFLLISWAIGKVFSQDSYYLVFAIYSFVSLYFLYRALDKYHCHSLGLVLYFFTESLFFTWDGIRQGAALSIILYAFVFIKDRQFLKYALCIAFATFFHTSAIILLPFYLISYLKVNRWINIGIIGVVLIGFWMGVFKEVVEQASILFSFMDNDYSRYENAIATLTTYESFNWKIRVSIYALFWMSIINACEDDNNFYSTLITIGAVIFILANGSLIFYRISLYFTIATLFAVPLSLHHKQAQLKRLFLVTMIAGMGLFFVYDTITGSYTRGCVPYKTILSEDAENKRFRPD